MKSRFLVAVIFVAATVLSFSTQADPIPTGTTPADDLIINFDLSFLTSPAPPFASGQYSLFFANVIFGTSGVIDFFGDLNGQSFIEQRYAGTLPALIIDFGPPLSGFADGIFSVGIRLTSGLRRLDVGSCVCVPTASRDSPVVQPERSGNDCNDGSRACGSGARRHRLGRPCLDQEKTFRGLTPELSRVVCCERAALQGGFSLCRDLSVVESRHAPLQSSSRSLPRSCCSYARSGTPSANASGDAGMSRRSARKEPRSRHGWGRAASETRGGCSTYSRAPAGRSERIQNGNNAAADRS